MKTVKSILKNSSLLSKLPILLVFVMSLILTSCSTEEVETITFDSQELSIIDTLDSYGEKSNTAARSANSKSVKSNAKPTFKTLSVALAKTGLAGTVSSLESHV